MNVSMQVNRIESFLSRADRYEEIDRREYRLLARYAGRAAALESAMKSYYDRLAGITGNRGVRRTCAAFADGATLGRATLMGFLADLTEGAEGALEQAARYFVEPQGNFLMEVLDRMLELCREKAYVYGVLMHTARGKDRSFFRDMLIKNRRETRFLRQERQFHTPVHYDGITWSGSYYSMMAVS